jgi:hypothetical protein
VSRRIPLAVAALAVLLTLSGCAGGASAPVTDAPPARAPTATATPTPEPVDPLTTVTSLVATPDALELRDGSGTVVTALDYVSDAAAAIATLEAVFGTAPVSEEYGGSNEHFPNTAHRWGSFELSEQHYGDVWESEFMRPPTLHMPAFRVKFTAPETGGIELVTAGGHRAGDSWTEVLAEPELQLNPLHCSGPYIDFIEFPVTWYDGSERLARIAVDFQPSDDATRLASVGAPVVVNNCV